MIVHTADGKSVFQADNHESFEITSGGPAGQVIIAAPAAKTFIRISYLMVGNEHATANKVWFQDGASGDERFKQHLIQGMIWNSNLVGCYWDLTGGATPLGLVVKTSGTGIIRVHVGYRIVKGG